MCSIDISSMIIISIEGNIGALKTTFIDVMECLCNEDNDIIKLFNNTVPQFLREDIESFSELLKEFDLNKHFGMQLQRHILECIASNITKNVNPNKYKILVMERSFEASLAVFTRNLIDLGEINNVDYWKFASNALSKYGEYDSKNVIYLKSSPEVCLERVNKRGRECEANVTLQYLTSIHNRHEEWLNNPDSSEDEIHKPAHLVYTINTDNMTADDIKVQCITILTHISELTNRRYCELCDNDKLPSPSSLS